MPPNSSDFDASGEAAAPRAGRHGAPRRRSAKPGMLLGAKVIVAMASIVVFVGAGYTWATFRSFTANVTVINAIVKPTPTSTGSGAATPVDIDGTDENVLLVGDDHRPAGASKAELAQLGTQDDGGGTNTDTMIVLHIPADGSRATMISFPRDSWVNIPGHGMAKLNSAFSYGSQNGGGDAGGAQLLIQVIHNMTGLTIDHFVRVSLLGFYDIAKVLGPIKVCLNKAAKDSYSGTNLPAGVSYLTPSQALSFVRQRHNLPGGDLDREVRQQYFLSAAFRTLESAGTITDPFKLHDLLNAVSSSLETDQGLDLLKFAEQFQNVSSGNLTSSTIPTVGTPTITYDGQAVSIVEVDFAALPGFIARVIGPSTAYTKATAAAASSVTVKVVNATGRNLAATSADTALTQLGFRTLTPGSQNTSSISYIEYPAGQEAQAKALAAVVPGAAVTSSASVTGVRLVLGNDGAAVTSPTASSSGTPAATVAPTSPAVSYNANSCIN